MFDALDMTKAFLLGCGAGACFCFFGILFVGGDLYELIATAAVLMASDAVYCAAMLVDLIREKNGEA